MGRAVGGASSVGCGVFGFLGLVIGIGLTVYLGAQAMSGVGGVGGSASKDRDPSSSAGRATGGLEDEVRGLTGDTVIGMEPSGATVTVTAPADLGDGGSLTVTGAGLSPGPVELLTCLVGEPVAGVSSRCDQATAVAATVDGAGGFRVTYPAVRVLTIDGTRYDCAARPSACAVMAHRSDNPLETGTSGPITFGADLPPVDAVAPPGA